MCIYLSLIANIKWINLDLFNTFYSYLLELNFCNFNFEYLQFPYQLLMLSHLNFFNIARGSIPNKPDEGFADPFVNSSYYEGGDSLVSSEEEEHSSDQEEFEGT